MSTDSTELTFVRCPSCRSLVPAISSRCRMCGATLDASTSTATPEGGGEQEAKKSGRVRQRTMSEPSGDASAAIDPPRAETPASAPSPTSMQATHSDSSESANDDPLSAYIEEVEIAEEHSSTNGGHAAKQASVAASLESGDEPEGEVEEIIAPVVEKREERKEEKPQQPKVLVESGNRRSGQGSNLSFGRSRENEPPHGSASEKPQSATRPPQQEARGGGDQRQHPRDEQRVHGREERRPQQEGRREDRRPNQDQRGGQQPQRDNPQSHREQSQGRHDQNMNRRDDRREDNRRQQEDRAATPPTRPQQAAPQDRSQSERVLPAPHASSGQRGKIFGWLVNYSEPSGSSIELREGKFFVTGKSLKGSDLVIEDKSISMPHALVVISDESGFVVQDLMSERGVYVRHGGGSSYKREEETVTLRHGDWVKFGDVEYLVSLISSEK